MQFDKERAIHIMMDELCYAYCDNCRNVIDIENCDDCHRKYQNWALSKETAEEIVNKIEAEAIHAV